MPDEKKDTGKPGKDGKEIVIGKIDSGRSTTNKEPGKVLDTIPPPKGKPQK